MNIKRIKLALLIAATASPVFASEGDTARQINAANTLVREGDFDKAIAEYQSATTVAGDLKYRLDYNLGVAQYRKGEIASAKEQFTQASASADTPLAAAARYNLGNCFYADAVASAEQDKPAAIEALTQAIDHYRGSLSGDPNHTDARANIELAGQLLKKLQEEQQEQQQEQQQDQQQDEQQDEQQQDKQDEQQQDQQQDQQQQGQQDKQDQQQQDQQKNEGQPSEQEEANQDQKGQQSEQEQSDAEQQSKEDQASEGEPLKQESAKPNESASDDAKPSEDDTPGDETEKESEQQEIPSGDLKPVGELDENQKPTGSVAMEDLNAEETPMSKEEALKMLQAVRDRDMLRRLRAEQIERRRHVPTDRDW